MPSAVVVTGFFLFFPFSPIFFFENVMALLMRWKHLSWDGKGKWVVVTETEVHTV